MESLGAFVPLVLVVVVVVILVRWRRASTYLKGGSALSPEKQDVLPIKPRSNGQFGATVDDFKKETQPKDSLGTGLTITIEYENSGYEEIEIAEVEITETPQVEVQDDEIETCLETYSFIFENKRPRQLKGTEAWFKERNRNKFLKTDPDKALDWILPFIPKDLAVMDRIRPLVEQGPKPYRMLVELRGMVREARAREEPHEQLLEAMYKVAVVCDFADTLTFLGRQPHSLFEFVALDDMREIKIGYDQIGLNLLKAPLKTDRMWFMATFGVADSHKSAWDVFRLIREDAISRECWKRLSKSEKLNRPAPELRGIMADWLRREIKQNLKREKRTEIEREKAEIKREQTIARERRFQEENEFRRKVAQRVRGGRSLKEAIAATNVPFAVADLETTGLNARSDEITEIGAILVEPDGTISSDFCTLIKTRNPIPPRITELTGIDDEMIRSSGRELGDVLREFISKTEGRPIFFHNAAFDMGFLTSACEQHDLEIESEIFDTLPLARKAWPSLGRYKLTTLAEHLNLDQPPHRALNDAKAALSVLLAAKDSLKS